MALLTVSSLPARTGVNITDVAVAASTSDQFANDSGNVFLYVKNASAATRTFTFVFNTASSTQDGVTVPNKTATLATAKEGVFGPFPTNFYNDANNRVTVNVDVAASVTYLPFKVS